jgi:hypothetical protein
MPALSPDDLIRLARLCLKINSARQSGIAGQAFTDYRCWRCGKNKRHPNTNVPYFCNDCEADVVRLALTQLPEDLTEEGRDDSRTGG